MSQLNPTSNSEPQIIPANLVVKGRVNIYARDIIATTPLEDLEAQLAEKLVQTPLETRSPEKSLEKSVKPVDESRSIPSSAPEFTEEFLEPNSESSPSESPVEALIESPEDLAAKAAARDRSMAEYRQLQYQLLLVTLSIALIIFITVWLVYSLPTALNYLLGGCTGVVYLKMLARDVERLGNQKDRLGYARLAPFIGLMIIATRWHDLEIVPIFLGFLTYKAAIIVYVLKTSFS